MSKRKKFKKINDNINESPTIDKSEYIYQEEKLKHKVTIKERNFTEKQKEFIRLATDKDTKMIFINGPAGTGKTFLSVYTSMLLLNDKKVDNIIYVRSAVESSDSKIGFLPGEADEKLAPYIKPLYDKLDELISKNDISRLENDNRLIGVPVGFLRGLNWDVKVIIADECQNMTFKEILTLITRVGKFSKIFILGDPQQSDIGSKSGFKKIYDVFNDEESKKHGIHTIEFTDEDIVRSELVKYIVKKIKKVLW